MRRLLIIAAVFLGLLLLLGAGALAYLLNADLSRYRTTVESAFFESTGRRLSITGQFQPNFGSTSTLIAEGVRIENARGSQNADMVSIDRVELEIDTLSMLFRPVIVHRLDLAGAHLFLERQVNQPPNWEWHDGESDSSIEDTLDADVLLASVNITDLSVSYVDAERGRQQKLVVDSLTISPNEDGLLKILMGAEFNALPLAITGTVGPIANLLSQQNIKADVDATWGNLTGRVWGTVADPDRAESIQALLESPAIERNLESLELPPLATGAMRLTAQISPDGAQSLFKLSLNAGAVTGQAQGRLDQHNALSSGQLELTIPDLETIGSMIGIPGAGQLPFQVSASLVASGDVVNVTDSLARLGSHEFRLTGEFVAADEIQSAQFDVTAAGPDLAALASLRDGAHELPTWPYKLTGQLHRPAGGAWRVKNPQLQGGGYEFAATGEIPTNGSMDDLNLTLDIRGADLDQFTTDFGMPKLGTGPFTFSGRFAQDHNTLQLLESTLKTDLFSATGSAKLPLASGASGGSLARAPAFAGTLFEVNVDGQDLNDLPGVNLSALLRDRSYELSGVFGVHEDRFQLEALQGTIANMAVSGSGAIVRGSSESNWSIDATGPDVSAFRGSEGWGKLTTQPFAAAGKISVAPGTVGLTPLQIRAGESSLTVNGNAHTSPDLAPRFEISFDMTTPSIRAVADLSESLEALDLPLTLQGQFSGNTNRFSLAEFSGLIGEAKIEGDLQIELGPRPLVNGGVALSRLDLTELPLWNSGDGGQTDDRVLSDEPIQLPWLDLADAELDLTIGELAVGAFVLGEFDTVVTVTDGGLDVRRAAFKEHGASFQMSGALKPSNGGFELQTQAEAQNVRLSLLAPEGEPPQVVPPLTAEVSWRAHGGSLRELAATANGMVSMVLGTGRVNSQVLDKIVADFFANLLQSLNPLSLIVKDRPFVEIECGRYDFDVVDGLATTRKMGLKSDSFTIVGTGTVDLNTERLDMAIRARPAEKLSIGLQGIGNEFFKVGGTLSEPKGELDQVGSVTTAGKAVATGGLSLLARGILGSGRSAKDVCGPET